MAVHGEPAVFTDARARGRTVVSELPKFDLEAYITNYKGRTRLHRLLHIARSSSHLYLDALKLAIAEARKGKDVGFYQEAVRLLSVTAPDEPEAVFDQPWIEKKSREVKAETDRLELELKGYKNNLIKESIRMGYDDMGRHYHEIGELVEAAKAYAKERDFCQTSVQVAIMYHRLLNVYVEQQSWLSVETTVQKLLSYNQEGSIAKAVAAMGLAHLETGMYGSAAKSFIACDASILQGKTNGKSKDESFTEILNPNDVAIYGALCALASMERNELQTRVLDNPDFRAYLELEPHLRSAISSFIGGKYSACLGIIESYRADYLLDLHLARHYPELLARIRSKAIVQYFEPFSCVTFAALAAAFNTDLDTVMQSLVELIRTGAMNARLDFERDLLVACGTDARATVHERGLETTRGYERTLMQRVQRIEGLGANLEIKLAKSQSAYMPDTLMGMDTAPIRGAKAGKSARGYPQYG